MLPARRPTTRADRVLELALGAVLAGLVAWLGLAGWRFYTAYVLPAARSIPTATATPVAEPEAIRAQARRMRQVLDHLGAAAAFRQANLRDAAIQELRTVLELDPTNADAQQHLREMGVPLPPGVAPVATHTSVRPTPSPIPTVTPRP